MLRRSSLGALAGAAIVAAGSLAHADQPPTPTAPPTTSVDAPPPAAQVAQLSPQAVGAWRRNPNREEETSWYGWQTLVADGTSLIVLPLGAAATQSSALGVLAVAGYFLAPPFIHGAHGRWGIFAASLGLRVGAPVVGGFLGAASDGDCRGDFCIPVGAVLGVVLGVLGAVALDASVLSYEKVEMEDSRYTARRSKPSRIAWSPTLAPRKEGGLTLGLGASF